MTNILTITLNPAIDKSATIENLVPEKKLKCANIKYEPGGGGINVSRVIKRLGGETNAVFLGGGHNGILMQELLEKEHVKSTKISCKNNTRENLIIYDEKTMLQYRFGMPSGEIYNNEWLELISYLKNYSEANYWVISGSIPDSLPTYIIENIINIAKEKKVSIIADSSGEALKSIIKESVFIIKPNINELSAIAGVETLSKTEAINFVKKKIINEHCEHAIVSLGAEGALLISKDKSYQLIPPQIKRISTVGAGDSMVAGISYFTSIGKSILESVQYGVAAGTAATMNAGTELCHKEDADSIFNQIKIEEVN